MTFTAPPTIEPTIAPDGAHLRKPSFLDNFRRITSSGDFIPEIDGLRFIAIAVVVLRHIELGVSQALKHEENWLIYGRHGVELFFAISGFILGVPFAMQYIRGAKPVKLKRYFLRRLTRLEPPYLISLLAFFVIKRLFRPDPSVTGESLLYSIFYVHGFALGFNSFVNMVAWSLEIEVQFYVLMPLLAQLYRIPNRWMRRGVIVLLAAIAVAVQPIPIHALLADRVWERHLLNYIQYFFAGLLLADIYATEWRGAPPPLRTRGIAWGDLAWLIGWPLLLFAFMRGGILMRDDIVMRAAAPAIIFALCLGLYHSVIARRFMRISLITVIGGMCYSIYLIHTPIIELGTSAIRRFLPQNFTLAQIVAVVVVVPLILIICGTFFRLIERPCMRPDWPKRAWAWLRRARVAPVQSDIG